MADLGQDRRERGEQSGEKGPDEPVVHGASLLTLFPIARGILSIPIPVWARAKRLDTPPNHTHGFAMYYLWLNEAQAGPYTLQQIQSMRNAGQITPETPYWQEGDAEWKSLSNILSEIEPKKKAESVLARTAVIRPFEQTIVRKSGNLTGASPAPQALQQPEPAQDTPEQVHSTGHPTRWKWAGLLLLILLALAGGLIAFWRH
jgi:hypothetical protein